MRNTLTNGFSLGRYRITRLLGHGTSGNVYLAHDTTLDVDVALKVFVSQETGAGEAWERFKRELLLTRRLAHPGICRLFDLHEEAMQRFITMEYVEGPNLEMLLETQAPLLVPRAVQIACALLDALKAAHAAGVVHRDLKPVNIIVTASDRPVILDFGFAKGRGGKDVTQAGTALGTPAYMAPELYLGQAACVHTDLWALSVILYRMLTGRPPFLGDNPHTLGAAVLNQAPEPPAALQSAIPYALSELLLRALSKEPERRPPSAEVYAALLAPFVPLPSADVDTNPTLSLPTPRTPAIPELPPPPTEAVAPSLVTVQGGETEIPSPFNPPTDVNTAYREADDDNLERVEHTVVQMLGGTTFSQVIRSRIAPTTILFSDIVGITSYFDRFGDVRGRTHLETHNNLLFPVIEHNDGTVVKTIGDAIMASFHTADAGVNAAVEMQQALLAYNSTAAPDDQIVIRIGLHSGEAIVEQQDVFGNTVNVAARIAARADGGQILVSADTKDALASTRHSLAFHITAALKGKEGEFQLFRVRWREETEPRLATPSPEARSEATAVVFTADLEPQSPSRPGDRTQPRIAVDPRSPRRWLIGAVVFLTLVASLVAVVKVRSFRNSLPATSASAADDQAGVVELTLVNSPPTAEAIVAEPALPTALPAPAPTPSKVLATPTKPLATNRRGTEPITTTTPTPPVHVEDSNLQRRRTVVADLLRNDAAMRTKGVIEGDSNDLDQARRKADKALKQARYDDAALAIRQADESLTALVIDKKFVAGKLERFNKRFDQNRNRAMRKKLEGVTEAVMLALATGDQATANRHLNRGFAMLK